MAISEGSGNRLENTTGFLTAAELQEESEIAEDQRRRAESGVSPQTEQKQPTITSRLKDFLRISH